jgi:ferredoxin-NADP reductase
LKWDEQRIEQFIKQLYIRADVIELGSVTVDVPRDPDNIPILATLLVANADVLVTGDADLLALQDDYPIETPARFVTRSSDQIQPGSIFEALNPAGDFVLLPNQRPVVLLSADIGITPMLSMLHALAAEGEPRPVTFLRGARDGRHDPFADEVREMVHHPRIRTQVAYSQPSEADTHSDAYDIEGRLTGVLVASVVPSLDAEFYLCGPIRLMAELTQELVGLGVPPAQIHAETFGPVS